MSTTRQGPSAVRSRRSSAARSSTSFAKLDPRHQVRNPVMFVVLVGSVLTTVLFVQALRRPGRGARRVHPRRSRSGSGSRCCSPTSPRRWPRAAARRRPTALRKARRDITAQEARRRARAAASTRRRARHRRRRAPTCARATSSSSKRGRLHPGRRRGRRGRRLGRRERDHRRERAGDPRERRRPQRGHRRHARALRLARRAHHRRPRRDLPRPHDRAGRGRQAPEDAERDRARHPARRRSRSSSCSPPSTLLPFSIYSVNEAGQGTPVTVTVLVALLVCLIPTTIGGLLSAIGIAGMDRMIQANVIAMLGPRGRGGGRRRRAAARQDRHDHARQPPGDRVPAAPTASTIEALADAAQLASLADETPEGRSIVVLAKEKYGLRERDVHALGAHFVPFTRADAHERRRPRRPADPQGRGRRDRALTCSERGGAFPADVRAQRRGDRARGRHAARRRRRRAACSA